MLMNHIWFVSLDLLKFWLSRVRREDAYGGQAVA